MGGLAAKPTPRQPPRLTLVRLNKIGFHGIMRSVHLPGVEGFWVCAGLLRRRPRNNYSRTSNES